MPRTKLQLSSAARADYVRRFLVIFTLSALLANAAAADSDAAKKSAASKPNVLVILADDLGFADVGFQGCKDVPTPHIDSIAANDMRFTAGYVTAPLCSPSRADLLSGRCDTRFGFEFNVGGSDHGGKNGSGIPTSEKIFSERMKAAGYATGIFEKWHVGFLKPLAPAQRGFDEWGCFFGACRSYFPGGGDAVTHDGQKVKSQSRLRSVEREERSPQMADARRPHGSGQERPSGNPQRRRR